MGENISTLIKKSKINDKESLWQLIEKFDPLINKYSRMLRYEDAKSELIEYLIKVIKRMPIMTQDKEIKYISISMKNLYIKLSKNHESYENSIILNDQMEYFETATKKNEISIDIYNALQTLEDKERKIIYYRYFLGYSDSEISKKMLISRQAVHKARKKTLATLKHILRGNEYGW